MTQTYRPAQVFPDSAERRLRAMLAALDDALAAIADAREELRGIYTGPRTYPEELELFLAAEADNQDVLKIFEEAGKAIGFGLSQAINLLAPHVVIVSGHNLGTAPIEDAINEHPAVAESAIVGFPHDIKGNALYGYIILKESGESRDRNNLSVEINQLISDQIGPIAKLDKIQFVSGLPKTRSGKIMRRILRKIAEGDFSNFGDITTLLNPEIVEEIKEGKL